MGLDDASVYNGKTVEIRGKMGDCGGDGRVSSFWGGDEIAKV